MKIDNMQHILQVLRLVSLLSLIKANLQDKIPAKYVTCYQFSFLGLLLEIFFELNSMFRYFKLNENEITPQNIAKYIAYYQFLIRYCASG